MADADKGLKTELFLGLRSLFVPPPAALFVVTSREYDDGPEPIGLTRASR